MDYFAHLRKLALHLLVFYFGNLMSKLDMKFDSFFIFHVKPCHQQSQILEIQDLVEVKVGAVVLLYLQAALVGSWLANHTIK